ncbi:MAG: helix-hairpin-helix domain-containing protein [bacterium]|nr:helix-hairpin-helix domain-containing protein [bacterium]
MRTALLSPTTRTPRGVALVAVLSVLTVLAILAAAFAVLTQLDINNANAQLEAQRLSLLIESGVNHAVAVIQQAQARGEKISTSPDSSLRRAFAAFTAGSETLNARGAHAKHTGIWHYVKNSRGILEGRYSVAVEDEAAKINLNTAFLLRPSPGSGWLPGELALTMASGLPTQFMQRILDFRYGPNRVPGARGDDDANNVLLMSDGIDNNANGLVDEDDEGLEDPGEYSPYYPMGDDRRITTISEALGVVLSGPIRLTLESRRLIQREIPRRTTLYSIDMPGSASLPADDPADINVVSPRQARKLIGQANMRRPFGATQRDLNQLAVNVVDYRDQNHVLSTHASLYGVEAINFNELLANDGTQGRTIRSGLFWTGAGSPTVNDDAFLVCSSELTGNGLTYNSTTLNGAYCWDCEVVGPNAIKLLGPAKRLTSSGIADAWDSTFMSRYRHYLTMRDRAGQYPRRVVTGNAGLGLESYETIQWPENLFAHGFLIIGHSASNSTSCTDQRKLTITSSTPDGIVRVQGTLPTIPPGRVSRCQIYTWETENGYSRCAIPRARMMVTVQNLRPRVYYLPVASGWPNHRTPDRLGQLRFAPLHRLDSDSREHRNHKWEYAGNDRDAEPVRSSRGGIMDLFVAGGNGVRYSADDWSQFSTCWSITYTRPEAIELINVSARPISIRNWTLTFNTGSIVNDIGVIDYGQGYSLNQSGLRDPNPVIMPNGYFYLVNNIKLFNAEFGSGTPSLNWGGNASQYNPVWQIPSDAWGVQYAIDRTISRSQNNVAVARTYLRNARFRPGQFKGEVIEFMRLENGRQRIPCTADGSRYEVRDNGRDWIEFAMRAPWDANHFNPQSRMFWPPADTLMIVGMPAKGGIVSMTLKNEYKQVVARTVEYAYLEQEPIAWVGSSAEKTDPTQYNWVVRRTPSISGRPEKAENAASRGRRRQPVEIKDGPYVSVGEVRRVRMGNEFANVGAGRSGVRQRETLAALADAFYASALRLEACDERAQRTGWQSAQYTVSATRPTSITASDAAWEVDMWRNHTVRFMTGRLRGEMFPIFGNSRNTLQISEPGERAQVRSCPGRKPLTAAVGDVFTVGPGYASGLCYARQPGQQGEWTWLQRIGVPGRYHLYIFGLSDSISTTEFLEENDNAALDIEVWNYATHQYDLLARNQRYGKDDSIYVGQISPHHISPKGDFKLRLTARDVGERGLERETRQTIQAQRRRQSGFAWFNYAMLTPIPVPGRVNVNTAGPRLLASLPGVSLALAHNIYQGVDAGGRALLKPYKTFGDLLKVRGMTPEIFERIANLLCLDSTAYTIDIYAQTLKDRNNDGLFDQAKEPVQGERHRRFVIRTDVDPLAARNVEILEQYTP